MPKGKCYNEVDGGWCILISDNCPFFENENFEDCEDYEEDEDASN